MLRRWLACVVVMVALAGAKGQIAEDFGDGELHHNPAWTGDTGSFVVNYLKELQLAALQEGEVYLSTGSQLIDSTEWLFRIRLGFSPSANNYARVYLVSDTMDLKGPVNGYYLQFGETGSLDAMTLFRQEGSVHTEVCRGESGAVAQAFDLRVRVTRSKDGEWNLYLRKEWENVFHHQATSTDAYFTTSVHFGLVCKFTASNKQSFWFDDIYVRHIYRDVEPPVLLNLMVLSQNTILLQANEPLHPVNSLERDHYILWPPGAKPKEISWANSLGESILLRFEEAFENPGEYELEIVQWCDTAGNCQESLLGNFLFSRARKWDILISEIMPDPEPPPFGLPALEYIELFNQSSFPVSLGGWKISIGTNTFTLKEDTLYPQSYYLLSPAVASWGEGVACQAIKSLSLPNTGGSLSLWDEAGEAITFLEYSSSWYDDPFKKDGGWSLEIIDLSKPWLSDNNWMASLDPRGGTPGKPNSHSSVVADDQQPMIAYAHLLDAHTLVMVFDKTMELNSMTDTGLYQLAPGMRMPVSTLVREPEARVLHLVFDVPFSTDSLYLLLIEPGPVDCSGNPLGQDSLRFGFSFMAQAGDLAISEILFNPWPGGEDFVEIYNLSSRVIDLSTLRICSLDPVDGSVKTVCNIASFPYNILPGAYRVLSPGGKSVTHNYPHANALAFLPDISPFPSYPDDKGGVALALYTGEIIDAFVYNKSMHSGFLADVEGVSLERVQLSRPAKDGSNWHSAAEAAGYATPGLKNSQAMKVEARVATFFLEPKEVSPNNDGWNDILRLTIQPEKPGTKANAWIFNAGGRLVTTLCRALTLATETVLTWEGYVENKTPVPAGIYILYAEALTPEGESKRFKEAFYLVRD